MWVAGPARRSVESPKTLRTDMDRSANEASARGASEAEEPGSSVVIVRPVKALASSLASSNAPALAGEAQTVVLEKASDWLSGSPDTQSGREVLLR